ncbi:MAG: hypothetical protein M5U01_16220 [Ardenticatenaceae bacterium]|nr:hypothetical protein [Ardenticatenaceae bacterium]
MVLESLKPGSREILLARQRQELERTREEAAALEAALHRSTNRARRSALSQQRATLLREAERLEDGLVQLERARSLADPATLLDLGVRGNHRLA